eukprot:403335059
MDKNKKISNPESNNNPQVVGNANNYQHQNSKDTFEDDLQQLQSSDLQDQQRVDIAIDDSDFNDFLNQQSQNEKDEIVRKLEQQNEMIGGAISQIESKIEQINQKLSASPGHQIKSHRFELNPVDQELASWVLKVNETQIKTSQLKGQIERLKNRLSILQKGNQMTQIENDYKAMLIEIQELENKKMGLENLLFGQNRQLGLQISDINEADKMQNIKKEIQEYKQRYKQMMQGYKQTGNDEQREVIMKAHYQMQSLKQQVQMYKLNTTGGNSGKNSQTTTIDSPNNRFTKFTLQTQEKLTKLDQLKLENEILYKEREELQKMTKDIPKYSDQQLLSQIQSQKDIDEVRRSLDPTQRGRGGLKLSPNYKQLDPSQRRIKDNRFNVNKYKKNQLLKQNDTSYEGSYEDFNKRNLKMTSAGRNEGNSYYKAGIMKTNVNSLRSSLQNDRTAFGQKSTNTAEQSNQHNSRVSAVNKSVGVLRHNSNLRSNQDPANMSQVHKIQKLRSSKIEDTTSKQSTNLKNVIKNLDQGSDQDSKNGDHITAGNDIDDDEVVVVPNKSTKLNQQVKSNQNIKKRPSHNSGDDDHQTNSTKNHSRNDQQELSGKKSQIKQSIGGSSQHSIKQGSNLPLIQKTINNSGDSENEQD